MKSRIFKLAAVAALAIPGPSYAQTNQSTPAAVSTLPPALGTKTLVTINDQTLVTCVSVPSAPSADGLSVDPAIDFHKLEVRLPVQKATGFNKFMPGGQPVGTLVRSTTDDGNAFNDQTANPLGAVPQPLPLVIPRGSVELTGLGMMTPNGYAITSVKGVDGNGMPFDVASSPKTTQIAVQDFYRQRTAEIDGICMSAQRALNIKSATQLEKKPTEAPPKPAEAPKKLTDAPKDIWGKLRGVGQSVGKTIASVGSDKALADTQMQITFGGVSATATVRQFSYTRAEAVGLVANNLSSIPVVLMLKPDTPLKPRAAPAKGRHHKV